MQRDVYTHTPRSSFTRLCHEARALVCTHKTRREQSEKESHGAAYKQRDEPEETGPCPLPDPKGKQAKERAFRRPGAAATDEGQSALFPSQVPLCAAPAGRTSAHTIKNAVHEEAKNADNGMDE